MVSKCSGPTQIQAASQYFTLSNMEHGGNASISAHTTMNAPAGHSNLRIIIALSIKKKIMLTKMIWSISQGLVDVHTPPLLTPLPLTP